MKITSLFSSKLFVVALIILSLSLGVARYRQYLAQNQVEKEKQKITQQMQILEGKNKELSDSIDYLNSSDFKERVARQQLNLKKDGEQIYNFGLNPQGSELAVPVAAPRKGNFQKWLNYFFGSP